MGPDLSMAGRIVVSVGPHGLDAAVIDWAAAWAESVGRPLILLTGHGPDVALTPDHPMAGFAAIAHDEALRELDRARRRAIRGHPRLEVAQVAERARPHDLLTLAGRQAHAVVVGHGAPPHASPVRLGRRDRRARLAEGLLPLASGALILVGDVPPPASGAPVVLGLIGDAPAAAAVRFAVAEAAWAHRTLLVVNVIDPATSETRLLERHRRLDTVLDPARCAGAAVLAQVVADDPAVALTRSADGAALLVLDSGEPGMPVPFAGLGRDHRARTRAIHLLVRRASCAVAVVSG